MKHFISIISIAMMASVVCVDAQTVTVAEPEFVNSYCILTSDSTCDALPKESGTIGKHENKVRKWSKVVGKVANVASAVGAVGFHAAGASGSPASELEEGEYGIFFMNIITAMAIPVGTFQIVK